MSSDLALGPRALYAAKAQLTHARSAWWLLGSGRRPAGDGIRILFYHRVSDDRDELAVTPRAFAEQMAMLDAAGFRGVSVGEVAAACGRAAEAIVGLSFDDGYRDVAEHAFPVLERLGFEATVFVATGVTAGRAAFSWYDVQPPLLAWDEIRSLDAGGTLRFEAHTVTHPNLLRLDEARARDEIESSKRELEQELGREVTGFCYPAGLFGDRERRLAAAAGYEWAASCEPGTNVSTTDRLALRRVQVDARDRLFDVRAKLYGGHDRPPPLRSLYRRARFGVRA